MLLVVTVTALQQHHKAVSSKCERWNDECVNTLSARKIYGGDLWIIPREVSRLMWLTRITPPPPPPQAWAGQKYWVSRLVSCGHHDGTWLKFKLKLATARLGGSQPKTHTCSLAMAKEIKENRKTLQSWSKTIKVCYKNLSKLWD